MTYKPAHAPEFSENQAISSLMAADMVTVHMQLRTAGHELALAVPKAEWLKLVSDFVRMAADERQRVGVSIREATAHDPFPADGSALSPRQQRVCDVFVNDCILLAALAEAVGGRILLDTAVDTYKIVNGLPQMAANGTFN